MQWSTVGLTSTRKRVQTLSSIIDQTFASKNDLAKSMHVALLVRRFITLASLAVGKHAPVPISTRHTFVGPKIWCAPIWQRRLLTQQFGLFCRVALIKILRTAATLPNLNVPVRTQFLSFKELQRILRSANVYLALTTTRAAGCLCYREQSVRYKPTLMLP